MESARRTMERRPLEIGTSGKTIIIAGVLDGRTHIDSGIEKELRKASKHREPTIDAASASILEGGAEVWVQLVSEFLSGCKLRYLPSQLGMLLQYDDKYRKRYPASVFDEETE